MVSLGVESRGHLAVGRLDYPPMLAGAIGRRVSWTGKRMDWEAFTVRMQTMSLYMRACERVRNAAALRMTGTRYQVVLVYDLRESVTAPTRVASPHFASGLALFVDVLIPLVPWSLVVVAIRRRLEALVAGGRRHYSPASCRLPLTSSGISWTARGHEAALYPLPLPDGP
jgi:hypothetical protein